MDEYIKREAAIEEIIGESPDAHYPSWYADKIEAIPAADVTPVVRCKDCKHYRKRGKGSIYDDDTCDILYYCDGSHRTACEEDFCSYGERRKDATD